MKITCRGRLKNGSTINWEQGVVKTIREHDDFIFTIEEVELFPKRFKYIQDNNDLEFLKIQDINE